MTDFFQYVGTLPRDYIFSATEQTLSPTISRVCTNISIVDDLVVEDTEFFTVLLESTNNAIINGSAEVDINDDDGELNQSLPYQQQECMNTYMCFYWQVPTIPN